MDYRYVSGQGIISKLSRDFGIKPTDWVGDAIEWVGGASEIIGCGSNLILAKPLEIIIDEYKCKLPCPVEAIIGITYKRMRLTRRDSQNVEDTKYLKHLPHCVEQYYTLNGNYINTSFECGTIRIHYYTLSLDPDGFPCIPDREKTRNAITWYLMKMLLGRGHTHPVFDYIMAEQRWEKYYPQAQNDLKMPSIDDMSKLKDATMRLVPNISREDEFFNERY